MNDLHQLQWPPLTKGTKGLLVLYFAIFIVHPLFSGSLGIRPFIIDTFYLSNVGMFSDLYLWQPLTYQLLHADFFHFAFNMMVLYFFGADVDRRLGTRTFVLYVIGCGLGAAAFGILWSLIASWIQGGPLLSPIPVVGASGAMSGIIAAYCLFNWNRQLALFGVVNIQSKWLLPIFVGIDLLRVIGGENLAFEHHLGGLLTGLIVVITVYQPLQLINRIKLWRLKRKLRIMKGDGPTWRDPDDKGSNNITYH